MNGGWGTGRRRRVPLALKICLLLNDSGMTLSFFFFFSCGRTACG